MGDCFVFGAALHDNHPVYLDIAGPATSVEAVWAKLAQGKEARIVPDTGSSIVLQPPEPGLFARFQRKIDGLGIDHLLLVHKAITEPVYSELTTTYMFFADKDQATAILGNHISRLVKVAVFPDVVSVSGPARPPGTPGTALHVLRRRSGVGDHPRCRRLDQRHPERPGFRPYHPSVRHSSRIVRLPRDCDRITGLFYFMEKLSMCPRLSSLEKGGYLRLSTLNFLPCDRLAVRASHRMVDGCSTPARVKAVRYSTSQKPGVSLPMPTNSTPNVRRRARRCLAPSRRCKATCTPCARRWAASRAIWLNPPYTWDMGNGDDKRRELGMLKHSWKWLQPGGWMLWVVYAHHVTPDAASFWRNTAGRSTSGGCRVCTWASTCTWWWWRRKARHRKTRPCSPSISCKTPPIPVN